MNVKKLLEIGNNILSKAKEENILLRITGGIGIFVHCPKFRNLALKLGRTYPDIDFASYKSEAVKVERLFLNLGYEEDKAILMYSGGEREKFLNSNSGIHFDIFFDRLHFCHDINLKGRLEIDYPTIPLVDLLLSKLQIVKINKKDIIDILILLREHSLGDSDNETINVEYLSGLCSNDWGLWRTMTTNLMKIKEFLYDYFQKGEDANDISIKIDRMMEEIDKKEKSIGWKLRNRIGERQKWYREVEETER